MTGSICLLLGVASYITSAFLFNYRILRQLLSGISGLLIGAGLILLCGI